MEYCAGGDMSMFIRSRQLLSEARARPFVQQIGKNYVSVMNKYSFICFGFISLKLE
jgi:hypothetical protein